uniref:Uncharacterized protein n=1 Tax=Psilocybe cubensis TaxID=181762 RepID=A0A8H7XJX1_PSICU
MPYCREGKMAAKGNVRCVKGGRGRTVERKRRSFPWFELSSQRRRLEPKVRLAGNNRRAKQGWRMLEGWEKNGE